MSFVSYCFWHPSTAHIFGTNWPISMRFSAKCSCENGAYSYLEKWKLNLTDFRLILLDHTTYVYLISSTSIQKENPFWNSIRQIKIRCAKYKIAERSHNFLMQLPMQLIFGVSWDLDKLQICAKGKSILEFHSVWKGNPKNSKNPKN